MPSFVSLFLYFLHLGTSGFGGPIALAARMHRDLVESRQWLSEADYKEGLAFAQLCPGPLAAQLAMYIGWLRYGVRGAFAVAVAFIAPSFLMVLAFAIFYVRAGSLPWVRHAFYGIGAAVIASITLGAYRLLRKTIRNRLGWLIVVIVAVATVWTSTEWISLYLLSGVLMWAWYRKPVSTRAAVVRSLFPLSLLALPSVAVDKLGIIGWVFLKAGAFVFGSGLAIVPFLYGEVVSHYHWLTEHQFLDAVAIAMITPGPVVITSTFIGFLVSGTAGAFIASLAVFAPPLFFVVLGAPYFRQWARNPQIEAFVRGVTAAAVGGISGAAIVMGRRSIIDLPTIAIAAGTLAIFIYLRRIPEPLVILFAGMLGLLIAPP
jgi:chromate transporter